MVKILKQKLILIQYVTLNRGSYWFTMEIQTGKKMHKSCNLCFFGDLKEDCPLGTDCQIIVL